MNQQHISQQSKHFTLENLPRLALTVAGIMYVFGFLVVMVHLSQYGIAPLALVRVHYIVAGILSVTPVFIAYIIIAHGLLLFFH